MAFHKLPIYLNSKSLIKQKYLKGNNTQFSTDIFMTVLIASFLSAFEHGMTNTLTNLFESLFCYKSINQLTFRSQLHHKNVTFIR